MKVPLAKSSSAAKWRSQTDWGKFGRAVRFVSKHQMQIRLPVGSMPSATRPAVGRQTQGRRRKGSPDQTVAAGYPESSRVANPTAHYPQRLVPGSHPQHRRPRCIPGSDTRLILELQLLLVLHPPRTGPVHQQPSAVRSQPGQELLPQRLAPGTPDCVREGRFDESCSEMI